MVTTSDRLWQEFAVCVRRARLGEAGEWEIVTQGPLARVIDEIAGQRLDPKAELKIALPDRGAAPFELRRDDILDLLRMRRQAG